MFKSRQYTGVSAAVLTQPLYVRHEQGRHNYVADVYVTSTGNTVLLFVDKEWTKMTAPRGAEMWSKTEWCVNLYEFIWTLNIVIEHENGNWTSTSTKPENGHGFGILCVFWLFAPLLGVPFNIVQELCESRGGRPGLSVLTSLLVSVDVKNYWTMLRHWSQLVPNMSADIWGH